MEPEEYARRAICLYLNAKDTPERAQTGDWQVASDLFDRGFQLEQLQHAISIASLRRAHARTRSNGPPVPIRSLAYFRAVLVALEEEAFDQQYVDYVNAKIIGD